ncbi:leucine zipper protein 2-like isoform X2 [Scyliorhinus torazame]|uniref:leucine zipper protein 2-like isoform X2 n=1 Tax=Scyliorhinus torazame TaxID=75743 RepID=UPI003B5CAA21
MNRACYFLFLFPALAFSSRRSYEDLERKLKLISTEKSNLLQQLSKSSTELHGMKGNLQALKTDEAVAQNDVQKLLEISQKQKDEMKSLQETLQKQINEAALKAEKQQAGINFLKTEVERKTKLIKDLQQENKSLKNKLLSGNKWCGIHAEESKRIQSQLKELRYGKKDLIFKYNLPHNCHERTKSGGEMQGLKILTPFEERALEPTGEEKERACAVSKVGLRGKSEKTLHIYPDDQTQAQQLTDLEHKLLAAKQELEKTAGDKEAQLKALKEVARLCVSGVLKNQPPFLSINPPRTTENGMLSTKNNSQLPFHQANRKAGKNCSTNQDNNPPPK